MTTQEHKDWLIGRISNASNIINIYNKTGIDHLTITCFMNLREIMHHTIRVEDMAEAVKLKHNKGTR